MSSVHAIALVAARDFVQRARSRAVLITTLLVVLVVFALIPLAAAIGQEQPVYEVGTVGATPAGFADLVGETAAAFDRQATTTPYPDETAGRAALADGKADVLVIDGDRLLWQTEPDQQLAGIVTAALQTAALRDRASALGLTPTEITDLFTPPTVTTGSVEPSDPQAETRRVATHIGVILMYMAIVIFGQFVLMGVMEEKQSRVVEVLLSRVRAHELLAGKVIGLGLLGLAQLLVLGGALLGGAAIARPSFLPDLPSIGLSIIATVVFWFLLGFGFYAVMYGALGALVTRQEDAQSVAFLPVLPLVIGIFIGTIATVEPDTTLVRVASIVPPTSPIVMPARTGVAAVPGWEIALAVALLLSATYGLVRLGGRVYSGGVLRLGGRVRMRDAWRGAGE